MAGDEEKKKKKKVKKATAAPVEEAAPAPEPEPVKEPEPVAEAPVEAQAEAAPAEGDAPPMGEDGAELPPQPKKKPKYFVHWDRRKPKFYDYNFDYGTNYYSSMVGYVDQKNIAFCTQGPCSVPRRMAFAERGMYSSLERSRNPDTKTQSLLNNVRSSIRNFEHSQRVYAYGKRN